MPAPTLREWLLFVFALVGWGFAARFWVLLELEREAWGETRKRPADR